MTITTMTWVLLAAGVVPWRVVWNLEKRRQGRRWRQWRSLTVRAVFWQLTVAVRPQGVEWRLTLPLIARCQAAVWAALQSLIKG